ncbi:MAG TPA: hypothetical protein DDX85_09690 [Nitrospiraceae bacterium]|nr:hypothetical protein [Nitrospiraceae bacterium]
MSEMKLSLLDKKIAQFCENSTELLTGIHARHKGGTKGRLKQGKRILKRISLRETAIDVRDEEPSGS